MKKSKKITGVLLACCALLMVAIAGLGVTLAKYVKNVQPRNDSARVAAFGVELAWSSNDSIFKASYDADTTVEGISTTVQSSNGTDTIIAPGTSGQVVLNLSGTSEVAFQLVINITEEYSNNWKESADGGEYHPIAYNLTSTAKAGDADITLTTGSSTVNVPAGVALSGSITITWEWAFEGGKDTADTYMSSVSGATYSITASATATQID